jgi:hypothetical protein
MCARGDKCPYAHNVFEYWLHPTRYRSQLCNDGPKCRRRVCFFAHTIDQLRVPPSKPFVAPDMLAGGAVAEPPKPPLDIMRQHSAEVGCLAASAQLLHASLPCCILGCPCAGQNGCMRRCCPQQ